ncbi:hypothetical protein [Rhodoferax bucti]|uniref:hypothetical protein n=1 Tax=Rhodoferax bucti TaxID=2576305 RepID=UPI001108E0AD|nr:hypothetical protein [Rhodoferax bucti]
MEPWQAIFDEYPSGRLEFAVMRGEDRSTLAVLSAIDADDFELLNSAAEFERRMADARQEAAFRNALSEGDDISTFLDANP